MSRLERFGLQLMLALALVTVLLDVFYWRAG